MTQNKYRSINRKNYIDHDIGPIVYKKICVNYDVFFTENFILGGNNYNKYPEEKSINKIEKFHAVKFILKRNKEEDTNSIVEQFSDFLIGNLNINDEDWDPYNEVQIDEDAYAPYSACDEDAAFDKLADTFMRPIVGYLPSTAETGILMERNDGDPNIFTLVNKDSYIIYNTKAEYEHSIKHRNIQNTKCRYHIHHDNQSEKILDIAVVVPTIITIRNTPVHFIVNKCRNKDEIEKHLYENKINRYMFGIFNTLYKIYEYGYGDKE